MGVQTNAQGLCHLDGLGIRLNPYGDTEASQILVSNINRTDTVSVILKTTVTGIVPICGFLFLSATWTGLGSIGTSFTETTFIPKHFAL